VGQTAPELLPVGHARQEQETAMSKSPKAVPATPATETDESNAHLVAVLSTLTETTTKGKFEVLQVTVSESLTVRALRDSFKKANNPAFKPDHAEFVIHLATIYGVRKDWESYEQLLSTFRGYVKGGEEPLGVEGAVEAMTTNKKTTAEIIAEKPQRKRGGQKPASEKEAEGTTSGTPDITLDNISDYLLAWSAGMEQDDALKLGKVLTSTAQLIKANAMAKVPANA